MWVHSVQFTSKDYFVWFTVNLVCPLLTFFHLKYRSSTPVLISKPSKSASPIRISSLHKGRVKKTKKLVSVLVLLIYFWFLSSLVDLLNLTH